jgi:GntR family transcriptional regulator
VEFIRVDLESAVPPSRQIVDAVLDAVAAGNLRSGDRLPSVRDLAVQVMLNPNTIGKAYRELTLLGAVQSRAGSGVFVADDAVRIARERRRKETLIDFRRAAEHALRAGHGSERLGRIIDRLAGARAEPTLTGEHS